MNESFQMIIGGKTPVLVDFSAEWCGPCKMMKPVLEQLKQKMKDRIRIIKIDVDRNRDIAVKYRISNVPTLMLFLDNKVLWSGSGVVTSNFLENVINNNCPVHSDQEVL